MLDFHNHRLLGIVLNCGNSFLQFQNKHLGEPEFFFSTLTETNFSYVTIFSFSIVIASIILLKQDDDAKVKRAFQTLLRYLGNVAKNPDVENFRKIRLSNPTFQVIKKIISKILVFVLLIAFFYWHIKPCLFNCS